MAVETAQKAYRVLARKYRPQDFSGLIGQEPMVRTLTNAFASGRIAQGWMLTGVRGVGKTTTARILARALNYKRGDIDRPTVELDILGEHCQAIMEGRHVDVVEMDAASHTGIDDIRDIIEQLRYRPVVARYKVYIIDEVHMLSTQAFNGLLKTLEEPPAHVKFIFATTEIRKVPITVLSRCQRFDLRRVDSACLTAHLRHIAKVEEMEAEDEALAMIARAGEGSVRDALSMLDQAIAHGRGKVEASTVRDMLGLADRTRIIDLFDSLMRGDSAQALREFRSQYDAGADPVVVVGELADFNHLVTRLRFTPELVDDISLSEEERKRGADFAHRLSLRSLSQSWQMLLKGISEIDQAPRPYQAAEMLLIRLSHAVELPSLHDVLHSIAEGKTRFEERAATPAASSAPEVKETKEVKQEPLSTFKSISVAAAEEDKTVSISPVATKREKKKPILDTLAAILHYADEKRDLQFKTYLKEYVRPVKITSGHFEFAPTDDAPANLSALIAKTLQEWSGERWRVILSQSADALPTHAEEERAKRETLLSDAQSDKDVMAILAQFPGARVVDVRLNNVTEQIDFSESLVTDADLEIDPTQGEEDA